MRESRTYGSVRGACDETHVPTATPSRDGEATMKLPRRQFLHLAAGAAALPAVSRIAWAQAYPTRPVRIDRRRLRAGGATDIRRASDRSMAVGAARPAIRHREPAGRRQQYRHRGGRAMRPLTAIRSSWSVRRTRSTRRSTTSSISISSATSRRSRASPRASHVMVVNPSVPAKTVPEFIAYAKANPGKINMASAGTGTATHLAGELFKMMAGVNMVHVPYRGDGPALTDLLGGQVQVLFAYLASSIEYIRAGKLRALAVTTATRSEALPDIPTVANLCRATRRALGSVSARRRTRPPRSSTSSTRRSMPASPIPR